MSNRYTIFGFIAVCIWSTTIGLASSLANQFGALASAAYVQTLSGLVCLLPGLMHRGPVILRPISVKYVVVCGGCFIAYMTLIYSSLGLAKTSINVIEVGLLNYLWSAFTILLSLLILKNRSNWLIVPGTLLAISGMILVLAGENIQDLTAMFGRILSGGIMYLFAFVAAFLWALYSVCARKWTHLHHEGALGSFMVITGLVLGAVAYKDVMNVSFSQKNVTELLILGLLGGVGYACWDVAMRKGSVVPVVVASYFIPLLSTLFISIYFDTAIGKYIWLGCVGIICGSLLSWRSIRNP